MTWPKALRVDSEDAPGGWWGDIYPLGSLYFSVNDVDPSTTFGFGVWNKYAEGRLVMARAGPNSKLFIWERIA